MRPDPRLHGFSRPVFERFGKPHVGCYYAGKSVTSHRLEEGALCACCGRVADNAHHWPPGREVVRAEPGLLRPSLIAVCGSGTTGCHDGFHGGARYTADWIWDEPEYGEAWLDGKLGVEPHSDELYLYGFWEFEDRKRGLKWKIRES